MRTSSLTILLLAFGLGSCHNSSFLKKKYLNLKPLSADYNDPIQPNEDNSSTSDSKWNAFDEVNIREEKGTEQGEVPVDVVKNSGSIIFSKKDSDLPRDALNDDADFDKRIEGFTPQSKSASDEEEEKNYEEQQLTKYRLISLIFLLSAVGLAGMVAILWISGQFVIGVSFIGTLLMIYGGTSAVGLAIIGLVYAFKSRKYCIEKKQKLIQVFHVIGSLVILYAAMYAFTLLFFELLF